MYSVCLFVTGEWMQTIMLHVHVCTFS